jgi:hypothetical protein
MESSKVSEMTTTQQKEVTVDIPNGAPSDVAPTPVAPPKPGPHGEITEKQPVLEFAALKEETPAGVSGVMPNEPVHPDHDPVDTIESPKSAKGKVIVNDERAVNTRAKQALRPLRPTETDETTRQIIAANQHVLSTLQMENLRLKSRLSCSIILVVCLITVCLVVVLVTTRVCM